MTGLKVVPMEPGVVAVEVDEGDEHTAHRITISNGLVDDLDLRDVDPADVARETVAFLLDRQPATALPREFSLEDVARDHDDFATELQDRLA